ncbi:MAG: SPOR domain-containing protein, partial [Natronospirillum sp.]
DARPGERNTSTSQNDTAPRLDPEGLPQGWSVRLGTFGNQDNAEGLVSRLREAGHKAYSRGISTANGPLTAVYVGPVLSRSEAETLQEELSATFELDGLVVEFTIEE